MRKVISYLIVTVVFASTASAVDFGLDNIWESGGWQVGEVDDINEYTGMTGCATNYGFAIQQTGGLPDLVQIGWSGGKWNVWVIDTNDYISITNDYNKRDMGWAVIHDGVQGVLYEFSASPGWATYKQDEGFDYKYVRTDVRPYTVFAGISGGVVVAGWRSGPYFFEKIVDTEYTDLAVNNYPNPSEVDLNDANFIDVLFGCKEPNGLDVIYWSVANPCDSANNWCISQISSEHYIDITVDQLDSVWAVKANGGLDNIYWRTYPCNGCPSPEGEWVINEMSPDTYTKVEADRANVVYAAREDGSLEQFAWNGTTNQWDRATISEKYYTEVANDIDAADVAWGLVGDLVPSCGDYLHPQPDMDFDGDCVVGFGDLAEFAIDWTFTTMP